MSKKNNVRETFKKIPSVDEIISSIENSENIPHHLIKTNIRKLLENLRIDIKNNKAPQSISKYISEIIIGFLSVKISANKVKKS